MAAAKSGAEPTVEEALESLHRCCSAPSDDPSGSATETAAGCKAKAERLQKQAEELAKGAAKDEELAAGMKDARDKYAKVYAAVQEHRDDLPAALAALEAKLCSFIGKQMAKKLKEALAQKTACRDEVCAAVEVLTGRPNRCYEPELCDCEGLSKADVEGSKAAAEAEVERLIAILQKWLGRHDEVKKLLEAVLTGIKDLNDAILKDDNPIGRVEYVKYLLLQADWDDKLAKLRKVEAYEARLASLFKKISHFHCHVLPAISDCLTQRQQDIADAEACCKRYTDDLLNEVVDAVATPGCEDERPPRPKPQPEPEPCDDEEEDEEDEGDEGDEGDEEGHEAHESSEDQAEEDGW